MSTTATPRSARIPAADLRVGDTLDADTIRRIPAGAVVTSLFEADTVLAVTYAVGTCGATKTTRCIAYTAAVRILI